MGDQEGFMCFDEKQRIYENQRANENQLFGLSHKEHHL